MLMADTAAVVGELAPTGRLRVALNHGNVVLVRRGPADDRPEGVSVDLARALASRLGLEPEFIQFERAADVTASAGDDIWDVCFLAVDPLRASEIDFSDPYVVIEGSYLVPQGSPAARSEDVDRLSLRVAVVEGSAYALHLVRAAQGARIVAFATFEEAAASLVCGDTDAMAGVRQAMERLAAQTKSHRLLDPPFMAIRQAMGVRSGRPLAASFVRTFLAELRAAGFVAAALARHGIEGVTVPRGN
jgi:polar amino acid transport system substrate-binding protein